MKTLFSFGPLLGIAIVKKRCSVCSSSMYSKQNFCVTGNVLYLSYNSHHNVTFCLPEFSSSFSWELQGNENENKGEVIITLASICT